MHTSHFKCFDMTHANSVPDQKNPEMVYSQELIKKLDW